MKSPNSNHLFSMAPSVSVQRSAFRRDRTYKTAFDAGYLVPIYVDEVLPGDTFNLNLTAFARLATPVTPFMDNVTMDFHFYFVPNRLVWENWERLCGARDNPGDSIDYLVPQFITSTGWSVGSLGDYFGLPVGVNNLSVSALPFRAYNLIWNSYYRDENLQDSIPVYLGDGPDPHLYDDGPVYDVRKRGKRKDYFTSCLPWPQKGPGVELPLGGLAPVVSMYSSSVTTADPDLLVRPALYNATTGARLTDNRLFASNAGVFNGQQATAQTQQPAGMALAADLSEASAITINTMRQAFQLQRMLERDARCGSDRYFEILVSHFGVRSPDARLQRPEYLGGGSLPVYIQSIAQTSSTDSTSPQGNLAANGFTSGHAVGFTKSFVEHGLIIGLVSVRADLNYQQGLDRMWSRRTRYDFYWPALAHLGEQAVLNKEIYCQGPSVKDANQNVIDDKVFGYQERWAEYRYGISKVTGKLRSGVPGSLDVWHLAQDFSVLPTLSADFIKEDPPLARVIAVPSEPQFIFDSKVEVKCVRPMPVYSVPGLIDHF